MSIEALRDAPLRVIEAWRRYDEGERKLREKYLSGPVVGPVERDAFESQLAGLVAERDGAIATIRSGANRENASDEAAIRGRLNRDLGRPTDDAIAAAGRDRVRPRLDAGFALSELLDAPGLTRADIAWLRSAYPAYVTAKVGPEAARAASTRREIDEAMQRVDAAELGLLDGDVRGAVVDSRARSGAERAMTRALSYDAMRRTARVPMPLDPATELELGYAIAADLGLPAHEPGRRDWRSIVQEVDPEMAARAARATLDPDLQTRLNDDARSGAVDHREPVER